MYMYIHAYIYIHIRYVHINVVWKLCKTCEILNRDPPSSFVLSIWEGGASKISGHLGGFPIRSTIVYEVNPKLVAS